jgi:hypothetical protein
MTAQQSLLFLMFWLPILGSTVGNPYLPGMLKKGIFIEKYQQISFRLGYEGDFCIDHRLKQKDPGIGRVDDFSLYSNSAVLFLNMDEFIDVYGGVGAGKIDADWRFTIDEITNRAEISSKDQFIWFIGANAIITRWGKACLGCGGRYLMLSPTLEKIEVDGSESSNQGSIRFREWQLNMGVSYDSGILIPYMGVIYDEVRASLKTVGNQFLSDRHSTDNHFKSRNRFGLYLGCSVTSGDIFDMQIEGRLIEEEALSLSCEFRF